MIVSPCFSPEASRSSKQQQQQAAASSSKQQQAAASSSKQQQAAGSKQQQAAAASSSKQQQAAASSSKQQQAAASSSKQQQAAVSSSSGQRAAPISIEQVAAGSSSNRLQQRAESCQSPTMRLYPGFGCLKRRIMLWLTVGRRPPKGLELWHLCLAFLRWIHSQTILSWICDVLKPMLKCFFSHADDFDARLEPGWARFSLQCKRLHVSPLANALFAIVSVCRGSSASPCRASNARAMVPVMA